MYWVEIAVKILIGALVVAFVAFLAYSQISSKRKK